MGLADNAKVADFEFGQEIVHGEAAQGGNHCRLNNLDLPIQPRRVGGNLLGQGVAIARRTIFNNVGNIDRLARQVNWGQKLIKQAAGRAAKRPAGLGLILPRRLAHQHNFGLVTPLANHRQIMFILPEGIKRRNGKI